MPAKLLFATLESPRVHLLAFDAAGCLGWARYSTGIGIALAITGVAEITRGLLARSKARADGDRTAHRDTADWTVPTVDVA